VSASSSLSSRILSNSSSVSSLISFLSGFCVEGGGGPEFVCKGFNPSFILSLFVSSIDSERSAPPPELDGGLGDLLCSFDRDGISRLDDLTTGASDSTK